MHPIPPKCSINDWRLEAYSIGGTLMNSKLKKLLSDKRLTSACPKLRRSPLDSPNTCVTTLLTACLMQCVITATARAVDILPGDYTALPSGTHAAALYYDFIQSNQLNLAGIGTFTNNTDFQANIGVYRYTYYGDINGRSWAVQMVVPF